jgi:hypothetical protein
MDATEDEIRDSAGPRYALASRTFPGSLREEPQPIHDVAVTFQTADLARYA